MEPNSNKFSELSPVLELIYVMLSNMAKYLKVYASDIDAEKVQQYQEAKEALDNAIKKFDVLYGLESDVVDKVDAVQEEKATEEKPSAPQTRSDAYSFASGADQESLKKAKEAVQELKTLFSDMKAKENVAPVADASSAPAPVMPKPVEEAPMPSATMLPPIPTEAKAPSVEAIPSGEVMPAPAVEATPVVAEAPAVEMPTPMNPVPEQKAEPAKQDAAEIDTILAELRKLQNKGSNEL